MPLTSLISFGFVKKVSDIHFALNGSPGINTAFATSFFLAFICGVIISKII
jgi:hypothetical protein